LNVSVLVGVENHKVILYTYSISQHCFLWK